MSKTNNELAKDAMEELRRLKLHIDAERAHHNMVTPPNIVKLDDYEHLKGLLRNLKNKIEMYQDEFQFSNDQKSITNDFLSDNEAILKYCDENIAKLQGKAEAALDEKKAEPAKGSLNPDEALKDMLELLEDAKINPAKISQHQNEVFRIIDRVDKKQATKTYLTGLKKVLSDFKNLAKVTHAQAAEQTSAMKVDDKKGISAASILEQKGVGITVTPNESLLPPSGFKSSELIKELGAAATKAHYMVEAKGNSIIVKNPTKTSEQLTITPTDKGVKLQGSNEMAVKTLEQWCQTNRWDPKDLKISMSTSDIDKNSDAAWKTLSTYTQKGFHVKDFPINDEKFKNMPNYAEIKQQYDTIKKDVEAKQSSSNKLAGG